MARYNGGANTVEFTDLPGTAISGPFLFGAPGGTAAAPRLHVALDRRTFDPDPATIELGGFDLP